MSEDAGAAAGGGGGGGADMVSGIMQAAAVILQAITSAVATGVDQQASPHIMAKRHSTRFNEKITTTGKWATKRRDAVAWLQNPLRRKQWMTGATARAAAPARTKVCPPLYSGASSEPNPGGHAYADQGCQCPSSPCAFKDPAGASHRKAILTDATYEDARKDALRSWGFLMGIRAMEPIFAFNGEGAKALANTPSERVLFDPASLRAMFPGDPDAARGAVPALDRSRVLTGWLNYAAAFPALSALRPPVWVYGLTPDEAAQVLISPRLGTVVQIADSPLGAQLAGTIPPGSSRISAAVRNLLLTPGGMAQLAQLDQQYAATAPPVVQVGIVAEQEQAQVPQQGLRSRRNLIIGGAVAAGLTILAAAAAILLPNGQSHGQRARRRRP